MKFRRAVRENVGLIVGLAGASGSGKTYSAMRLASGIAGDKPFAVIDTEAGRAKHYADMFAFDHADLRAPFNAETYTEAIRAADTAGYEVIVVDSVSHVWAGDGGALDQHEAELQRMAGEDWRKRDKCTMAAWIKPKSRHKRMVSHLLQVRAHQILCFRAEEKVEMVKDEKGKMQIVPKRSLVGLNGWMPVCEKALPFELTASILLLPERPGIPIPIKLQKQHRHLFPDGEPICEKAGKAMAEWAAGGAPRPRPAPETVEPESGADDPSEAVCPAEVAATIRTKWAKAVREAPKAVAIVRAAWPTLKTVQDIQRLTVREAADLEVMVDEALAQKE